MPHWRPLLVVFASLTATPALASAQVALGRVADVRRLLSCQPASTVTDPESQSVLIGRPSASRISAVSREEVRIGDTLLVRRMIDAKVYADSLRGFGVGDVVFAPELAGCTSYSQQIRERGRNLTGSAPGRYVITRRAEKLAGRDTSRLLIVIEYGGLVVDWKGGLFSLVALGREIRITGTRLAVAVDSAGSELYVAVLEGAVEITSALGGATTRVSAGEVARAPANTGNVAIERIQLDVARNLTYHLVDVWRLPVQPPPPPPNGTLSRAGPSAGRVLGAIAIGVGVAAGGWYAYDRWFRKDPVNGRRSGTVILQIPL